MDKIGADLVEKARKDMATVPYVIMDVIVLGILSLLPVLSLYLSVKAGL